MTSVPRSRASRVGSGTAVDEKFYEYLRACWRGGKSLKQIAHELGCCEKTVTRYRKLLGLPRRYAVPNSGTFRRGKRFYNDKMITVHIRGDLLDKVDQHIFKFRIRNRSTYIRSLIARDLGM